MLACLNRLARLKLVQLRLQMRFHAILLLLPPSLAFQLPFSIPFFRAKSYSTLEDDIQPSPPSSRIAIIGAGAGGSSAAFWISKAKERFGLEVEIDVYERANYIGGRKRYFSRFLLVAQSPSRQHRCISL